MKNIQLSTTTLALVMALIYILYLTQCNRSEPCPVTAVIPDTSEIQVSSQPKTDTVYLPGQTITKKVPVKGKDSFIYVPVEVVKPIPVKVDTQAILQDYYSVRIQSDSLITSDVRVSITDTVYQNRIVGRMWNAFIIKKAPIKKKRYFYMGGEGFTSAFMNKMPGELISAASIGAGYINRKGEHIKISLMRANGYWHQGIGFYHTFGYK